MMFFASFLCDCPGAPHAGAAKPAATEPRKLLRVSSILPLDYTKPLALIESLMESRPCSERRQEALSIQHSALCAHSFPAMSSRVLSSVRYPSIETIFPERSTTNTVGIWATL